MIPYIYRTTSFQMPAGEFKINPVSGVRAVDQAGVEPSTLRQPQTEVPKNTSDIYKAKPQASFYDQQLIHNEGDDTAPALWKRVWELYQYHHAGVSSHFGLLVLYDKKNAGPLLAAALLLARLLKARLEIAVLCDAKEAASFDLIQKSVLDELTVLASQDHTRSLAETPQVFSFVNAEFESAKVNELVASKRASLVLAPFQKNNNKAWELFAKKAHCPVLLLPDQIGSMLSPQIVVALDSEKGSFEALSQGIFLAQILGGTVHVIHVEKNDADKKKSEPKIMEQMNLVNWHSVTHDVYTGSGDTVSEIVNYYKKVGGQLLVMGTHRVAPHDETVPGKSTVIDLLEKNPLPLLIVHPYRELAK